MPYISLPSGLVRPTSQASDIIFFLLICYSIVTVNSLRTNSSLQRDNTHPSTATNYWTGPLTHSSFIDSSILDEKDNPKRGPVNALTGPLTRRQPANNPLDKKRDEVLSTDCYAKRRDIVRKQHLSDNKFHQPPSSTPVPPGYQRLKPKRDPPPASSLVNESLIGRNISFDSEHIPQCTQSGKYEPVQCHKIGYCWCVNKFGQAIKNSAALFGEKPSCDMTLYESDSNDLVVVTGVSAQRMKNILKVGSSNPDGSHSNKQSGSIVGELSKSENYDRNPLKDQESEFSRRVSASQEPSLALVPNECSLSRENAIERASKHTDDSIWIPGCDFDNQKLYAEKQCHKSKVCWCVDQISGLPLRASEQLTKQTSINCTEIKRIIDVATNGVRQDTVRRPASFVQGFSESCDADKRSELVVLLINQFRQQLGEYVRLNPTSAPPEGITSMNPYKLSESQVSTWKFATMDLNLDGKLDDREWSKFKVNFKLVDKVDIESYHSYNQPPNTQLSLMPLSIARSQRRCWRDFIQFCGNGDVLTNEPISLAKWLSCTELPSKSNMPISPERTRAKSNPDGIPDAYTRAAAIARSKKKNPFLGILKPD